MIIPSRLAGGAAGMLLLPLGVFLAAGFQGDLQPLADQLRVVVQKHYPKATVKIKKDPTLDADFIEVSFNTRKYWIHSPTLSGTWQDAHEEIGPQRGGVYATLELRDGLYKGQAAAPQDFDERYYVMRLMAPYSRKLDQHLYVHFKFAKDASKEFKADINKFVNAFEK